MCGKPATTCRAGGLRKPPEKGRKMNLVLVLSEAVLVIVIGFHITSVRRSDSHFDRMTWFSSITITKHAGT